MKNFNLFVVATIATVAFTACGGGKTEGGADSAKKDSAVVVAPVADSIKKDSVVVAPAADSIKK